MANSFKIDWVKGQADFYKCSKNEINRLNAFQDTLILKWTFVGYPSAPPKWTSHEDLDLLTLFKIL